MGNALGIGLATGGAIVGAVVVLSTVPVFMGVGESEERCEAPTITLPVGMGLLAGIGLFVGSVMTMVFIIAG